MRRYKVTVEVVKSYEIEIDDEYLSNEMLEGWESVFYKLDQEDDKISSLVHDYCEARARLGNKFIEGHGIVLEKNKIADGFFIKENEVCEYMQMIKTDDEGETDVYLKEIFTPK